MGRWLIALGLFALGTAGCVVDDTSALYEGCSTLGDCSGAADECFDIAWGGGRGGMCSLYCDVDANCPGWAACYELVGDPLGTTICYERCDDDFDCDIGFQCTTATIGGIPVDAICLP